VLEDPPGVRFRVRVRNAEGVLKWGKLGQDIIIVLVIVTIVVVVFVGFVFVLVVGFVVVVVVVVVVVMMIMVPYNSTGLQTH